MQQPVIHRFGSVGASAARFMIDDQGEILHGNHLGRAAGIAPIAM